MLFSRVSPKWYSKVLISVIRYGRKTVTSFFAISQAKAQTVVLCFCLTPLISCSHEASKSSFSIAVLLLRSFKASVSGIAVTYGLEKDIICLFPNPKEIKKYSGIFFISCSHLKYTSLNTSKTSKKQS